MKIILIQFEDDTLVAIAISVQLEVDSESSLRCSYNNFGRAGRGGTDLDRARFG